MTVGGSVNTAVVGQYTVTYDAVDAHGNHAAQVTRTVNVVDSDVPVITMLGSTPSIRLRLALSMLMLVQLPLMVMMVF